MIKIGIVGSGKICQGPHMGAYDKIDNAEIVAICDIDEKKLEVVGKRYPKAKLYTDYREMIDNEERMREHVMLRMRLSCGVNRVDFEREFGVPFEEKFPDIKRFVDSGHVICDAGSYKFSDEGFFVSSYILSEILDFS